MKATISILSIFICCAVIGGCKKPSNSITGGGTGGTSTLKVTGEAHGYFIDTCVVYIKYGALNAPENGIYDDSCTCVMVSGTPFATFSGLTIGNYYLLAVGIHGAYSPPNVKGGKTVTISENGVTDNIIMTAYQYIP